jgi:hypothetical protein
LRVEIGARRGDRFEDRSLSILKRSHRGVDQWTAIQFFPREIEFIAGLDRRLA